jgi:hypothetical protein
MYEFLFPARKPTDLTRDLLETLQHKTLKETALAEEEELENMIKNKDKEMAKLAMDIKALKADKKYLPAYKVEKLRSELRLINELSAAMKENSEGKTCPICLDESKDVFSCAKCRNWVCDTCKGKVASCPSCRDVWKAETPQMSDCKLD